MTAMSIRNIDEDVKERLRILAARHGRSMEAEARAILTDGVYAEDREDVRPGLGQAIMDAFGAVGGVELDIDYDSGPVRGADFT